MYFRFHCVLQYKPESDEKSSRGFYIYDLDSTHGTYLNKNKLKPRCFQKIQVGHFLNIGGSTRMYFLQVSYNVILIKVYTLHSNL